MAEPTTKIKQKRIRYMSPEHFMQKTYTELPFTGQWEQLMGRPSPDFAAIVYGAPKQGKSTFSLMLANYLSEFGLTLYVSGEEGFAKTIKDRLFRLNITKNPQLVFIKERKKQYVHQAISNRHPRFVIIDSAHHVELLPQELRAWKEQFTKTCFITILQSTKNGDFKGDTAWEHDADIVVQMKQGIALQRGRYCPESRMVVVKSKMNWSLYPNE